MNILSKINKKHKYQFIKADKTNYGRLAEKLDNAGFDEISIEDAEAKNDLSILAKFKRSKVN